MVVGLLAYVLVDRQVAIEVVLAAKAVSMLNSFKSSSELYVAHDAANGETTHTQMVVGLALVDALNATGIVGLGLKD